MYPSTIGYNDEIRTALKVAEFETAHEEAQQLVAEQPSDAESITLLGDARWAALVRELMLEVIATANAKGLKIDEGYADYQIDRTRVMELARGAVTRSAVMPQYKKLYGIS